MHTLILPILKVRTLIMGKMIVRTLILALSNVSEPLLLKVLCVMKALSNVLNFICLTDTYKYKAGKKYYFSKGLWTNYFIRQEKINFLKVVPSSNHWVT